MKKIVVFLFFVVISHSVYAFDWSNHGLTVSENRSENTVVLSDSAGNSFIVENNNLVRPDTANAIIEIKNSFVGWKYIKINELKFLVTPTEIQIAVKPRSFTYDGTNAMTHVTSGLFFNLSDGVIRYDFRINVNNMFLKITGVYLEEEILAKKITDAIKDPTSLIRRGDTDYLLSRIDRLDEKTDTLHAEVLRLNRELDAQTTRLKGEISNVDEKVDSLGEALVSETNRLNRVMMAFQNDRFFYKSKPINEALIRTVLEIKTSNIKATVEDVVEELKGRQIKHSKKEIEIIFAVFYNEFAKE